MTSKSFALPETPDWEIEDWAEWWGAALKTTFQERDSSYWGGVYYMSDAMSGICGKIRILQNRDIVDGRAIVPSHPADSIVLLAEEARDTRAIEAALSELAGVVPTEKDG